MAAVMTLPKRRIEKIPLTSADTGWVSDYIVVDELVEGNERRVRICHKIGEYEPLTTIYERVDLICDDKEWGKNVGEGRI